MRILASLAAAVLLCADLPAAQRQPKDGFHCGDGSLLPRTIRYRLTQADAIVFGHCANARRNSDDQNDPGRTDFVVHEVLMPHALTKDLKLIQMSRYVPETDSNKPRTFVAFVGVEKGKLEVHDGIETGQRAADYVKAVLKLGSARTADNLRFFLRHVEDTDVDIAYDAYAELSLATPALLQEAARDFSADKVWRWLRDPKIMERRGDLYVKLLGACGTSKDVGPLLKLYAKNPQQGGIIYSLLALDPKRALERLQPMIDNPKLEFYTHHTILRELRIVHQTQYASMSQEEVLAQIARFLDVPEMADFAVDALRDAHAWDFTRRVVAHYDKMAYPVGRRAVLRFALRSPRPAAINFVAAMRKKNPEWVAEIEELLKLEYETK